MFVGMGFVLLFLFILIIAISWISTLINRFFPEIEPPSQPRLSPAIQTTAASSDVEALRPVIVAAIAHHRRQQGL